MASTLVTMRGRLRTALMDWGLRWPIAVVGTGGVAAGAITLTLTDARNLPSAGAGSLERDIFSWTGKTGTTVLTGIPSSGVGALDSAHGANAYVRLVAFSDGELGEMLNRAVAELSRRRPLRTTVSLVPTLNRRRITIAADSTDIRRIYYLDTANGDAEYDYTFDIDKSRLEVVLDAPWGDSTQSPLIADVVKSHDLYSTDGGTSTVESIFEPALLLLAEAEAYLNLAGDQARVAVWSRGNTREDAPRSADACRELAETLLKRAEKMLAAPGLAVSAGSVDGPESALAQHVPSIFRSVPV